METRVVQYISLIIITQWHLCSLWSVPSLLCGTAVPRDKDPPGGICERSLQSMWPHPLPSCAGDERLWTESSLLPPPVAPSTLGSPVSSGRLPAPLVKLPAGGQVFGQPLQLLQSCFTAKVPALRVHRLCPPRDLYPSADTTTPEHTSGD